MKKSYKTFALTGLALILLAAVFLPNYFAPKQVVPWRKDFAATRAEAARLKKPIFIEFSASWCGPCQEMAHTTWADKDVAAALKSMVPIQVDIDENHNLALQYGVNPIPAYAVLDSQGTLVKFGEGYRSPGEFLAWLNEKSGSPTTQIDASRP